MLKVAFCESGNGCAAPLDEKAKNPLSSASGIFQITKGTWEGAKCKGDIFTAKDNIDCAVKIYADSGLTPWEASRSGWE